MGRFFEYLIIRGVLFLGVPVLLAVLAIGPARCQEFVRRLWSQLWQRKLEPEAVIEQVVKQYREMVKAHEQTLARARTAETVLDRNILQSEHNLDTLENEAREAAKQGDEFASKGIVSKTTLERQALDTFREQRVRHARQIDEIRGNLHATELQLRQYEVGRELLLSQLAEAKTVEQQYRIASEFDPFSAVANWKKVEGMVEEQQLTARVISRVAADLRTPIEAESVSESDGQVSEQKSE